MIYPVLKRIMTFDEHIMSISCVMSVHLFVLPILSIKRIGNRRDSEKRKIIEKKGYFA